MVDTGRGAPLRRELTLPHLGLRREIGDGGKAAVLIVLIGLMQRGGSGRRAASAARPVPAVGGRAFRLCACGLRACCLWAVEAVPQLPQAVDAGEEILSGKDARHAYSVGLTSS